MHTHIKRFTYNFLLSYTLAAVARRMIRLHLKIIIRRIMNALFHVYLELQTSES